MKTIIYAGIGLFTAASLYGIADYYSSEKKGQLNNLYKDEPVAAKTSNVDPPKPDIKAEDYSRAKLEDPGETEKAANVVKNPKLVEKNKRDVVKKTPSKRKSPKIKFSDFSRSALIREKKLPEEVAVTDSSTGKY